MNAITELQKAGDLAVAERAARALKSTETEQRLKELAASTADIVIVTNKDGREQVHRAYMVARETRVSIEKTAKAARDDANNFSKAVVAEERRLAALIEPEEVRLKQLRDDWDAEEERLKAAKKAAEEARVNGIMAKIKAYDDMVTRAAMKTAEEVRVMLADVEQNDIDDSFEEFFGEAKEARGKAKQILTDMVAVKSEAERVAAEAAEQNRKMAEQMAELQRQNAELLKAQAQQAAQAALETPAEPELEARAAVPEKTKAEATVVATEEQPVAASNVVDVRRKTEVAADPVIRNEGFIAGYLNGQTMTNREHDWLRAHLVEFVKFVDSQLKEAA